MTRDEARALDGADPLAHVRSRFRLPDGVVYLDGNSLGALPAATPARLAEVAERQWGDDLIGSWNKHGWIDWPTRIAAKLSPIVGANPSELIIADSTSVSLFKLLGAALTARPDRHVILTEDRNFPTDLYVAEGLAAMLPGKEVRVVAAADVTAALDEQVAVVMLTHVDYRSAACHDMAGVNAAARAAGALTLWDLSHSAGAVELSLAADGCDLAVGCGYKYLNGGPGAPAFIFVAEALQAELSPPIRGWMGHAEPFAFQSTHRAAPGMSRFLSGTPSILALAALDAGLDSFAGVTMAAVQAKSRALAELFVERVADCPGVALASPADPAQRGSHISLAHPHAYAMVQALIARGIIGDFREPNLMRFGFAPLYNSFEDVWLAAAALRAVAESGIYREQRFATRAKVT